MSMEKNLGTLERVPLREVWVDEANDFTPELAPVMTRNNGPGTQTC